MFGAPRFREPYGEKVHLFGKRLCVFFFFLIHLHWSQLLKDTTAPQREVFLLFRVDLALEEPSAKLQQTTLVSSNASRGKKDSTKDTIIIITSDSQVNSNFPYRWSAASLTFNNYLYIILLLYNENNHE